LTRLGVSHFVAIQFFNAYASCSAASTEKLLEKIDHL